MLANEWGKSWCLTAESINDTLNKIMQDKYSTLDEKFKNSKIHKKEKNTVPTPTT
jgi:hypothetical protein